MDRGQSLVIPPLFDGTNYAYWKVRTRVFLQSLDEKVWQAVEIGWTKPMEASVDWDDAKIKVKKMLYSVQSLMKNSIRYLSLKLRRKYGPSSRQPMKESRLSRIQSFRGSLQALKRSR